YKKFDHSGKSANPKPEQQLASSPDRQTVVTGGVVAGVSNLEASRIYHRSIPRWRCDPCSGCLCQRREGAFSPSGRITIVPAVFPSASIGYDTAP
ncbi:hypothetical protein, partial [Aureimonas phyllosphaerae]|uniref:hypothetical protein n=1 Tax=Aureimonas phyllosphaerae TaxID=1166078 RepID=UPI001AEEE09F